MTQIRNPFTIISSHSYPPFHSVFGIMWFGYSCTGHLLVIPLRRHWNDGSGEVIWKLLGLQADDYSEQFSVSSVPCCNL